jgi:hypothetical protein
MGSSLLPPLIDLIRDSMGRLWKPIGSALVKCNDAGLRLLRFWRELGCPGFPWVFRLAAGWRPQQWFDFSGSPSPAAPGRAAHLNRPAQWLPLQGMGRDDLACRMVKEISQRQQ